MTFASEFSAALAASRARKGTALPHAAPTLAAPMVPAPPRATSWSEIADIVNAQAGLARGANITPTAAARDPSRARTAPPKAGAADWADVAAIVNADAGVTPPTTGAR